MPSAAGQTTRDAFFGGRLKLRQPATGHRSGTDAVLLAAAVPRSFAGRLYDIGAGAGAVGLGVALGAPSADVTLVENDPACLALAAENIADNALSGRVRVAACDILSRAARGPLAGGADLVVTNPPFYRAGRVRAAADAGRRAAHVLAPGVTLADWLAACLSCLAGKGTLIAVHPAEALPETLSVLVPRLGDVTLLAVHPRDGEPASRVLVRGTLGRRGPFRVSVPLVLHQGHGFTPLAADLHAGETGLDW